MYPNASQIGNRSPRNERGKRALKQYFKETEVAEIYGLTVSTLRKWRLQSNPHGPIFTKLGARAVRYRKADLIAWEAAGRKRQEEVA
jgi:predicted DNA-binding transcriptional regulator AlpA